MDQEIEHKTNLSLNLTLSTINSASNIYTRKFMDHDVKQKDISLQSGEDEEELGEEYKSPKKKLRLTEKQYFLLEHNFKKHPTLNPKDKEVLAKELNMQPRQVEVWFQNRRARTRLKQTETNYELMRRYCEALTKENKRLRKEMQELTSLKSVPKPPIICTQSLSALTMCPSCKRIYANGFEPSCEIVRPEHGSIQGPF